MAYTPSQLADIEAFDRPTAGRPVGPFGRETRIDYSLVHSGPASLKLFDVGGRELRTLISGMALAGNYTATWDGRDASGRRVGSGTYYYRLTQGAQTLTRKLVVAR